MIDKCMAWSITGSAWSVARAESVDDGKTGIRDGPGLNPYHGMVMAVVVGQSKSRSITGTGIEPRASSLSGFSTKSRMGCPAGSMAECHSQICACVHGLVQRSCSLG